MTDHIPAIANSQINNGLISNRCLTGGGPIPPELLVLLAKAPSAVDLEAAPWTPTPLEKALEGPEKRILLKVLKANNWNRQSTADQLQINRTTLYKKMKVYGLDRMAG